MGKVLSALQATGRAARRLYAFLLAGILLYVFYLAVSYLVVLVFYQAPVPQRLLAGPSHLEAAGLRTENVPGVTGPAARAPFAHYHKVEKWLQVDRVNGCTLSGCHEPLPHSRSIYVRSFANLHSTFMTCEMCHEPVKGRPVSASWASTASGLRTEPPALIQLMHLFQTQRAQIEQGPAAFHQAILGLLGQVVEVSRDPLLGYLQLEISTAEPGSPVWRDAVVRLDEQLAMHTSGEYGAKIAPWSDPDAYLRQSEHLRQLAKTFKKAPSRGPSEPMQDEIHKPILPKPDRCTTCHGDTPPLVDFQALGYSPQRAGFLRTNPIARQVQDLREGRQFYLPSMTEERR